MTWKKRTTTTSLLRFVANVDETGGRNGSCSFVSYGIAIVIVIIAMDCAVVGDGIVGRAIMLAL
jgi:hypothetical protein